MVLSAVEKGKLFEDEVATQLHKFGIDFQRQKRVQGLGGRWRVDFYCPKLNALIECKNINTKRNKRVYLNEVCLKFIDIRNAQPTIKWNFNVVIKNLQQKMGGTIRLLTKYQIKVIDDLKLLKEALLATPSFNERYPKVWYAVQDHKKRILNLLRKKDGLTKKQIATTLGFTSYQINRPMQELEKARVVLAIRRTWDKQYYLREFFGSISDDALGGVEKP